MSMQKIDDNLAGITSSSEVIPMGRPEIEDRPGEALVDMVVDYRAAGGFRKGQTVADDEAAVAVTLPEANGLVSRYTTDADAPENELKD